MNMLAQSKRRSNRGAAHTPPVQSNFLPPSPPSRAATLFTRFGAGGVPRRLPGLPGLLLCATLCLAGIAGLRAQTALDAQPGVGAPGFGFDDPNGSPGFDAGDDGSSSGDVPSHDDSSGQDPSHDGSILPPAPAPLPVDDGIHTVYRWLGAGIGPAEWDDPDNWYPRGVPDASDTAVISRSGQQCPIIADHIEVGTVLFDDSLDVDFTISANTIYINTGLQLHWNDEQILHHTIQVSEDYYMLEVDSEGKPTDYFSYRDHYGESARLGANYLGSTLELLMGVDPNSTDFIGDAWQQEAHYWDFEFGIVDEVGDVEASTSAQVWLSEIPGWGTVLDFSQGTAATLEFPQGLGDGNRVVDYSLSFWFQLTSLDDQVLLDLGGGHDLGGLSVLICDARLRAVAYADIAENSAAYPPVRFEAALPKTGSLALGSWYLATLVFEGEGGPNGHGALSLYLNHDQSDYDASGKDLQYDRPGVLAKRVLVVDQSLVIGAQSGAYAAPGQAFTPNAFSGYLDNLAVYPEWALSSSTVAALYEATVPGLRHEWSFSHNLNDSAPSIATAPAITLATRTGAVPSYDTGEWIDTPAAVALSGTQVLDLPSVAASTQRYEDYTLSLWFKPETTDGSQILFDSGDAQNGFALRLHNGRLQAASVAQELGRTAELLSVGPVSPGLWHLATLVNDSHAGTLTLSLDNYHAVDQLDYQDSDNPDQPWLVAAGGQSRALGGASQQTTETAFDALTTAGAGGQPFSGRLDRVRVHAEALSMATIEQEYYSYMNARPAHRFIPWDADGHALPHQVAMRDETSGVTSQQWHLPYTPWVDPSLLIEEDALAFNNGHYVKINEQSAAANDLHESMDAFTVNIWFKPPSSSSNSGLLQYLYQQGGAMEGITLRLNQGYLEGAICGRNGGANQLRCTALADEEPVEADEWQLATLTFDGLSGELLLYLDSELIAVSETELTSINPGLDSAAPYYAAIGAPFTIGDYAYEDAWGGGAVYELNPRGLHGFRVRSVELIPGLALDRYRIRAAYDTGFLDAHWNFELTADDSLSGLSSSELGTPDYNQLRAIDGEWSLQLDGSSGLDYGYDPLELMVDGTRRSYSWSLWVRPEVMDTRKFRTLLQNSFVHLASAASEFQQMELIQFGSELEFSVARAPENDFSSSLLNADRITATLQPDVWNHIVAVFDTLYDGDPATKDELTLQLYVNGIPTGNSQSSGIVESGHRDSHPLNLVIGMPQYERVRHDHESGAMLGFEGLRGLMDDLRFYQHALDADEVRVLYDFYRPEDEWR